MASSTRPAFSIALTAPPARQCGWRELGVRGAALDDERRRTVPRQATQTSKDVGSVTMPASARTPWATAAIPPAPEDSSSVTVQTSSSPASRSRPPSTSAASTIAATPPFMSQAPRP